MAFGPVLKPSFSVRHQAAVVGHPRFEFAESLEDSRHGGYFRLFFVSAAARSSSVTRASMSSNAAKGDSK
jgi:hypothetical protein